MVGGVTSEPEPPAPIEIPEAPTTAEVAPDPARGMFGSSARTVGVKLASNAALTTIAILTARALGPTGRGVLVLLLTLSMFSMLIGSLGVNVAARVHLVRTEDPLPSGHYFGLLSVLLGVQLGLCMAVAAALLPLANVHIPVREQFLFSLLGAATLAQYLLNDALNAYGFVVQAAVVDAAGSWAQLGFVVAAVVAGADRVEPFLVALIAGTALQVLLALAVLCRRGVDVRPRYSQRSWRLLVRAGMPGMAAGLGEVFTYRIDRYLLALFATPAAVGLYSVASTAPELLRLPALALGMPIFHRLASGAAAVRDFRRLRRLCFLATGALGAVAFAVAPVVIRATFGVAYAGSVTPLRILLLGELGIAMYHIDGAALGGLGSLGYVSIAALTGLALVAAADVILIPAYGVAGAAWASAVAYSVMGITAGYFLRRRIADPAADASSTDLR
jgi:O-antigen/teichoic acid export membrane protein